MNGLRDELIKTLDFEMDDVVDALMPVITEHLVESFRGGYEAADGRLAAALDLALHDAHPTYANTTGWRGGIGGQAMTPGCSFIDPPPGEDWTQFDLLSTPLREWLTAQPDFDLNAAKAALKAELLAKLGTQTTEEASHD